MKINFKILSMLTLALTFYTLFSYLYVNKEKQLMTLQKYNEVTLDMKSRLSTLITEKKEAVTIVSLALSINDPIKKALISKDMSKIPLNNFLKDLNKDTSLKNVWIQIIDAKGFSRYRSWTSKTGDYLGNIRLDVAKMLQDKRIYSVISVGKFDMTFKTLVPIYNEKKFIGIVETIAKFNSIAIKMHEMNSEVLILVDKSYKNQLTKVSKERFTKKYYVANIHPDRKILDIVANRYLEKFLSMKSYFIDEKDALLFSTYSIVGLDLKPMAYFILSKSLSEIDMKNINTLHKRNIETLTIVGVMIGFIIYFILTMSYEKFIQKQNRELEEKVASKTKELHHTAHHDSLTGLPNRLFFLDSLEQSLKSATRHKQNVAVLFLDLDRFKEVNDTYGHEVGDKLLIDVTNKLQSIFRKEDIVARLGGDEFTVILQNINDKDIIKLLNKTINIMHEKCTIDTIEINTTFSIGVSLFPKDGITSEILLRNADTAMYTAKENGKNAYAFYDKEMTELAFERVNLENDIIRALENGEFEPYFQVQMDSKSDKVIGMEVLIRWNHPTKGLIFPDAFITFAEEIGMLSTIDNYMMKKSMKIVLEWYKKGLNPGVLSLNLSAKQLENDKYVEEVKEIVTSIGFDYANLELEILEGQVMHHPKKAIEILEEIRDLGVMIAVDDFGTGYSSLSYLKTLPIDKLKIDRSFVRDLPANKDSVAIVKTIIALANNLDLEIIAEGAETKEQVDFLRAEGCAHIQGYYYSKPIPADKFEKLLQEKA